ncbi:glycosyltransferase family 2 protein [Aliiroseovarius subalbicans]|uniref:glycosyltransferase family 2 protein n=1 Tax=Aliiroseovarius subalbicans TaxID=2925840 RepID=UPI001F5871B4|nr:glycosyltransferase family 2 protein [uncultured Aliiroseovarius sp.]MCI2401156.1 glycosyltransferase family 2 protein [Aliiroseovarius subalbicans]
MTKTLPKVSILVVSYNTREMTLDCLRSLKGQTTVSHEVIVVDNVSSDGSPEAIAAEFPEMRLMAEQKNHGFAKGNNIAAEHARGDYILLLNPDTVVLERAIDRLVDFANSRPEARIWGGRTLFGDHSLNPGSCWGRMGLWAIFCRSTGLTGIFANSERFNPETYGGWDRSSERQVDIVSGCFFLIRRADWEALGGFDETFFMYGEEADLCLRAIRDLRAAPRVTPDAEIIHFGGASEKVRADKMVRLLAAKATLLERHVPAWQRPVARFLYRLWPWSRQIAYRVLRRNSDDFSVWREVWDRRAEWQGGFIPR